MAKSEAEPFSFRVETGDPRERLDKLALALLARRGFHVTRATIQRWIEHGRVSVDGATARASVTVKAGATVVVAPEPPPPSSAEPDASVELRVVHEDQHLIVIDKPAGLVVHPAKGHLSGTLVNGLLARGGFENASADSRDPIGHFRPGIVHRLDKGTSGLLVVAKDERTREGLKALFSRHDITRAYVAVVIGDAKDAVIDTPHGRHPSDRLRFTSLVSKGKRAITHVHVLERLRGATLVECVLATGRTHQIRVHLTEQMRTPVLGDPVYGAKSKVNAELKKWGEELGHQALHARVLGFVHPITGEAMCWRSELPADVARVIDALRVG